MLQKLRCPPLKKFVRKLRCAPLQKYVAEVALRFIYFVQLRKLRCALLTF